MKIKRNSHYRWGACRAMDRVVAQVSNLLYRRASSLRVSRSTRRNDDGNVLPIGNRRYSRLETCATPDWPDFVNGAVGQGSSRGFTLIEMIGVLTVICILALALMPTLIKQMDRMAAEKETAQLKAFGEAFRSSVVKTKSIPNQAGWAQ